MVNKMSFIKIIGIDFSNLQKAALNPQDSCIPLSSESIQRRICIFILQVKSFFGDTSATRLLKFHEVCILRETIESSFLSDGLLRKMRSLFLAIVVESDTDLSWDVSPLELLHYVECLEWDYNDNSNTHKTLQRNLKASPEKARIYSKILHSQTLGSTEKTIDILDHAWEESYSRLEATLNNPFFALRGIDSVTQMSVHHLNAVLHDIFNRFVLER